MKIFISSTYEDLKTERKEAINTIDRIGQAVAMEKFFSSNHQSKQVCLSKLQQCDAIILILGDRYGHIDSEEGISITEIEYNTAKSLGLPAFVFIKKDRSGKEWRTGETEAARIEKHNVFKTRIDSERFRKCFTNNDQLGKEIIGAIREYEVQHGLLGARIPIFISPKDFFKPFADPNKLFNHTLSLVGRTYYLRCFNNFTSSKKRVLLMYGRGGIGKSKILFEFSNNYLKRKRDIRLLFLREGISLDAEAIRQLPSQQCVVIVDDAHRREDLKYLFAISQQYPTRIKIVLSFRPEGINYIKSTLTQLGFDIQEIEELEGIKDLSPNEMKELARYALGPRYKHLIDPLFATTKDCPLATVIGGQLISRNLIDPRMLERQGEFQSIVFNRFQEIIIGEVSKKINPDLCRSLLSLISALSPIRIEDERFQKQAAQFLKVEKFNLIDAIGVLEQNGILFRRGYQLRITPDILSDHILYNSCLTSAGDNTGYAKEVFDAFCNIMPENVLLNIAELDWRVTRSGKNIDLLSDIWKVIEEEFYKTSHRMRAVILGWLKRMAYFQPKRALALIEYAMRNPATGTDAGPLAGIIDIGHSEVVRELPSIIQGISYNLEYLPRCCDLLWELGRDDARNTNSHTDHAIRILKDLADYDIGKPLIVNKIVLEAIERALNSPNAHEYAHSPLDILDSVLVKEGHSTRSEGAKFIFNPFVVSFKKTKLIREKAIKILVKCTKLKNPKIRLRAIRSLMNVLPNPHGLFGRPIQDQERKQWIPEQLAVLKTIHNFVKTTKDIVIQVSIFSDLQQYAKHASPKIKDRAQKIIKAIPKDSEFYLIRALWNRYERDWDGEDHEIFQIRVGKEVKRVTTEFLNRLSDSKKIFNYLNNKLKYFQQCGIDTNPTFFLSKVSEENPKKAYQICKLIIEHTPCLLEIYLHSMLYALRQKDKKIAISLIKAAVKKQRKDLCLSIGHAYAWGRWELGDDDIEIIKELLRFPDREVKKIAIKSLKNFRGGSQRKGIDLAVDVDIGEDEQLGDELCEIFHPQYGISSEVLSENDIKAILSKLSKIKKLTDDLYHIDEFLKYVTGKYPLLSASFLIRRYRHAIQNNKRNDEYQPMPYLGFRDAFKNISSQENYVDILKEVRSLALVKKGLSSFWLPNLFRELSDNFCPSSLEILKEWVDSDEKDKIIAVSLLLREAPDNFVFHNYDFVKDLLECAHRKGEEVYREVSSNLFGSAISGDRTGTPGQPMPQDVALKEQAEGMRKKYLAGSPVWNFYDSLRQHAERSIRDSLARDEEIIG